MRAQDVAPPWFAGDDPSANRDCAAVDASAVHATGSAARLVRGRAGHEPLVGRSAVDRARAAVDTACAAAGLIVLARVLSVCSNHPVGVAIANLMSIADCSASDEEQDV